MKLYKTLSVVNLALYTVLMFIEPLAVAYIAIGILALNVITMYSVEYYVKKEMGKMEEKRNASLLSALKKLKRL